MVKCFYCAKVGKKLEKCKGCRKDFHAGCRRHFRKNHVENCCELNDDTMAKSKSLEGKCHQCSSLNLYERYKTCIVDSCKKSFCTRCLKNRYKADIKELHLDWKCFACNKMCLCKACRKEASTSRIPKLSSQVSGDCFSCHRCSIKINNGKCRLCKDCDSCICFDCFDLYYKNLENCPVCLDICDCVTCGNLRFNKDFPEFQKGVDLRELYPHDIEHIFYHNGYWVRNINL